MEDDYQPEHRADNEEPVIGDAPPRSHILFSNRAYDVVKFLALVVLPAIGALYFGLAPLWGLPKADEVVGTIVVVDTFLGVVLGFSTSQYRKSDDRFDGEVHVQQVDDTDEAMVGFAIDSRSIVGKDEIVLKVQK